MCYSPAISFFLNYPGTLPNQSLPSTSSTQQAFACKLYKEWLGEVVIVVAEVEKRCGNKINIVAIIVVVEVAQFMFVCFTWLRRKQLNDCR